MVCLGSLQSFFCSRLNLRPWGHSVVYTSVAPGTRVQVQVQPPLLVPAGRSLAELGGRCTAVVLPC